MNHENELSARPKISGFVIFIACIAAIAGILFGFDTGVISGAILFIKPEFKLSPSMAGFIVSAVPIGAFIGAAVSGRFSDLFGRRNLLLVTAVIFLVGTIGAASSHAIATLFINRLTIGFAIGIASFTAPLYISEVSPAEFRGALVTLNQLAITIGIMLAYLVDAYFAKSESWRWMFAFGVIPASILFIGAIILPHSPRWLVLKGKLKAAEKTLKRIRKANAVHDEISEIQNSLKTSSDWRLLTQKWLRPVIIVALGMAFFQQFTGINAIIYYAPTIFQLSGFKSATVATLATVGIGLVNVFFTIIAIPLIDRLGRRMLLFIGLTGMTIGLLILSTGFFVGMATSVFLKWISFGSILLFIASFAVSIGPIMWLLFSEIFPLEIRGLGSSLAASSCWAFTGIVAFTFLIMVKHLGPAITFLLFSLLSIFGIIFVYQLVPETKNTTLENIENNLRTGVPSRYLGSTE